MLAGDGWCYTSEAQLTSERANAQQRVPAPLRHSLRRQLGMPLAKMQKLAQPLGESRASQIDGDPPCGA